jgi:predicted porin
MSVKAKYDINNTIYLAARYSQSTNESTGISGDDTLDRVQLGLGYRIEDNVLLKLEYVKQTEEAFSGGQATDGTGEAEWDGVVAELSVTF